MSLHWRSPRTQLEPGVPGPLLEAMMKNPLLELARFGQSYWLDELSRRMIRSGELQRGVAEEGLTGVTLNPTIFHAALSNGTDDFIESLF